MIMANMKNTIRIVLAAIVLALACVGCADRMVQFSKETYSKLVDKLPKSPQPCYVHTVRWPRETFSIIAKWYTGNIENSDVLVRTNTRLDPKRLFVGTKVLIPEDIMVTKVAMPKSFVYNLTSQPKKSAHVTRPPSPQESEPEKSANVTQSPSPQESELEKSAHATQPPSPLEEEDEFEVFGPKGN